MAPTRARPAIWAFAAFLGLLALGLAAPAGAQAPGDAFSGFRADNATPIQISSKSLEVRDQDGRAVFSGDVVVQQADTVLKTKVLKVFYSGSGAGPGEQRMTRLEASGRVYVRSKDQTATGQTAVVDLVKNTAVLSGNVVLSQGENVARGERLVVDLTTGKSRLEANKAAGGSKGRVQVLIVPSNARKKQAPGQ